jgi:hypothetical protein
MAIYQLTIPEQAAAPIRVTHWAYAQTLVERMSLKR